jgi:UDP-2,3-diacylglucosamine pyrophosphatase LpxH
MGNRYLVVSDLHLADVEDHPDGWKAYKSSRFLFDDEFTALVRSFVERETDGDRLTLILNGDSFDFDLVTAVPEDPPWPVTRFERKRGLRPTAERSVWKLQHVLSFHARFVATLAEFVAAGNRLVLLMGNHDRELHFPEVQQALVEAIETSAREQGRSLATGTIRFEPWFYYVPHEIYVEHGHQYDFYTTFRYQLWPTVTIKNEQQIALPMGNLSNRYLMNRMGFFNPHAMDYILNIYRYVTHWVRHYLFSRRSLAVSWMWGSLLVILMLLRIKKKLRIVPPEHLQHLERIARRFDLSPQEIEALGQLHRRPITSRMFRLIRELWFDRVLIAAVMTGGTVALALVPVPLWVKLMVPLTCFPLVYFIYEQLAQGETIFTAEKEIPNRARAVAKTLPARVVALGHTHTPRLLPLDRNTTFVDTGTWAPILDKGQLRPGLGNYLTVSFHRKEMSLFFGSYRP